MKKELLPKNESDVKLRPDWFTSEATSLRILVGRAGSAIENLPHFVREKSLRFLSVFSPPTCPSSTTPLVSKLRQERQNYNTCEDEHVLSKGSHLAHCQEMAYRENINM